MRDPGHPVGLGPGVYLLDHTVASDVRGEMGSWVRKQGKVRKLGSRCPGGWSYMIPFSLLLPA